MLRATASSSSTRAPTTKNVAIPRSSVVATATSTRPTVRPDPLPGLLGGGGTWPSHEGGLGGPSGPIAAYDWKPPPPDGVPPGTTVGWSKPPGGGGGGGLVAIGWVGAGGAGGGATPPGGGPYGVSARVSLQTSPSQ